MLQRSTSGPLSGRGRRAAPAIAAILAVLLVATAFAAVGGLTQKPGKAGCISNNGNGGLCVDGKALLVATGVTVSPDGANIYVATFDGDAVAIFDRNPTTGVLTQKPDPAGCVSEAGNAGVCADGIALDNPFHVAISPDGANAYVSSIDSGAVAVFDRNTSTGALTQKPGLDGCISETGTGGLCVDGTGLTGAIEATVSPDGANVYVGAQGFGAVAIFDRNTTTGALTQKPGLEGCISDTGAGPCVDGTALGGARGVTVSPNGANVYLAALGGDAVAIFDRNTTTGALTQKPGLDGCISETGTGGLCVDGTALDGGRGVRVSPDGANVYVTAQNSDAVTIFDRNTTTGALTQKPGVAGCISDDGTGGLCVDGTALDGAHAIPISADGANIYVASFNSGSVSIFDRDITTGALTQKPGTAGCISDTGTGGACVDGLRLDQARGAAISPDDGNVYIAAQSDALTIFDRDASPETTIDAGPSDPTNDETPGFSFSSNEAGASFECALDAAPFAACSGPGASHTTPTLTEGPHSFAVRAIDPATNPDLSPATQSFNVDTTEPETKITKQPKKKVETAKKAKKVKVSFKSEPDASFECKVDKDDFEPCSSPLEEKLKSKPEKGKKHKIQIRATDTAGNVETSAAKAKFRLIRTD